MSSAAVVIGALRVNSFAPLVSAPPTHVYTKHGIKFGVIDMLIKHLRNFQQLRLVPWQNDVSIMLL